MLQWGPAWEIGKYFWGAKMPIFERISRFLRLSPTALCEVHEAIHAERPAGEAAERALRRLRCWPALWLLPRGNIYIRHHLTLSALMLEVDRIEEAYTHAHRAISALKRLCDGPYLEGWSYFLYCIRAYDFWAISWGHHAEVDDLVEEQAGLHQAMALPDGSVPTTDTRKTDTLPPDTSRLVQHAAFTASRKDGWTTIVHHDARLREWRARLNLHVAMTYGAAVREEADWPHWYDGWDKKRMRLRDQLWRLFPPRMEMEARGEHQVILRIGKEKKIITL